MTRPAGVKRTAPSARIGARDPGMRSGSARAEPPRPPARGVRGTARLCPSTAVHLTRPSPAGIVTTAARRSNSDTFLRVLPQSLVECPKTDSVTAGQLSAGEEVFE